MALISLRQLLDHAAEKGYGVPAFNVNNLEQVRAIMEAADEAHSPVILQASAGARKYAGSNFLKHLIQAAIEEFPHIPIVMHQDHGVSPAVCQRSIQLGFSSVMMDGSLGKTARRRWTSTTTCVSLKPRLPWLTPAACPLRVRSVALAL
jgi:fructose-bisphosphate aldolase class II